MVGLSGGLAVKLVVRGHASLGTSWQPALRLNVWICGVAGRFLRPLETWTLKWINDHSQESEAGRFLRGMSNCVWLYYLLRLRHSQRLKLILQITDMILLGDDFVGPIVRDKTHNKSGGNEPDIYDQIMVSMLMSFLRIQTEMTAGIEVLKTENQGFWLTSCIFQSIGLSLGETL